MSDHKFKNWLELTFLGGRSMVLCFLSMRLGTAILFCCNTDSITGKVGSVESLTRRRWVLECLVPGYGCSVC